MNTASNAGARDDPAVPIHILLVEDSPSDAAMTVAALREARIANEVHVVTDGEKAMEFLRRVGRFVDSPRIDLMILDLNLPRMDGREVLEEMKKDPALMEIPVVVLTSSSAEADVRTSYKLHANAYVTKPVGFDEFFQAVHGIEHFWLSVVKLPST